MRERCLTDVGRPRRIERRAVLEPELGDAVPRFTALVRRRAGHQADAVLLQLRKRPHVRNVLVDPPAMESLARPGRRTAQQNHDLDHGMEATRSPTNRSASAARAAADTTPAAPSA